jgi:anti-sigma factor RsiW
VGWEHWSRFTDRDLPPDECLRCEEHLKTCAECRKKVRAVKDTVRACRQARLALPSAVKAGARKRVQALLSKEGPQGH